MLIDNTQRQFGKKIIDAFPNNKIEFHRSVDPFTFTPYICVSVDGKDIKHRWNVEMVVDMKAKHGEKMEEEMEDITIEVITEYLKQAA